VAFGETKDGQQETKSNKRRPRPSSSRPSRKIRVTEGGWKGRATRRCVNPLNNGRKERNDWRGQKDGPQKKPQKRPLGERDSLERGCGTKKAEKKWPGNLAHEKGGTSLKEGEVPGGKS